MTSAKSSNPSKPFDPQLTMPPTPSTPAANVRALIDLTHTTQTLLSHFQSSLAPQPSTPSTSASSPSSNTSSAPTTNPLDAARTTATLLKSHTTTLSLLLLTPPLSAPAISRKIGDVSAGCLAAMVAAASPPTADAAPTRPDIPGLARAELAAAVRRVLSAWSGVLSCVRSGASAAAGQQGDGGDAARGAILAATGVVWEGCDALVGLCEAGVVGLAVRRAEEWRGVLLDAVVEMREWGEEADEDGDGDEDGGEGSGEEGGFEVFGAANRLGKGDGELRALLEASVRKLKTVAVLYQALVKRRLKTFPPPFASAPSSKDGDADAAAAAAAQRVQTLDELMALLKSIPESVDELASAFYDLDGDEAKVLLKKCCDDAVRAATIVKQNWDGKDDEFTAWSGKWKDAMGTS